MTSKEQDKMPVFKKHLEQMLLDLERVAPDTVWITPYETLYDRLLSIQEDLFPSPPSPQVELRFPEEFQAEGI